MQRYYLTTVFLKDSVGGNPDVDIIPFTGEADQEGILKMKQTKDRQVFNTIFLGDTRRMSPEQSGCDI